jgi:hypothetical protein
MWPATFKKIHPTHHKLPTESCEPVQDFSLAASLTAASVSTAVSEAASDHVEVVAGVWYARLLASANAHIFSSAPPNSKRI